MTLEEVEDLECMLSLIEPHTAMEYRFHDFLQELLESLKPKEAN